MRFLLELPDVRISDTHAFAAAVSRQPALVYEIPEFRNPDFFGKDVDILRLFVKSDRLWDLKEINEADLASLPEEIHRILARMLDLYSLSDYRFYPR